MRLATMVGHTPGCTGCPACRPELARVLSMNVKDYAEWLRGKREGRTMAKTMRTTAKCECEQCVSARAGQQHADPPPSLTDRIRASRATKTAATTDTGANQHGVPRPPSMADRIRRAREVA